MNAFNLQPSSAGIRSFSVDLVGRSSQEPSEARCCLRDGRFLKGSNELSYGTAGLHSSQSAQYQRAHTRYVVPSMLAMFEGSLARPSGRSATDTDSLVTALNPFIMPAEFVLPKERLSENTMTCHSDLLVRQKTSDCGLEKFAESNFQDPDPASNIHNLYDPKIVDTHGKNIARRRSRARFPLSFLQGTNQSGGVMCVSTVGTMGSPVTKTGRIQGPIGVVMVLLVTVIAISAAAKRRLFTGLDQHQQVCSKCHGFGLQSCHICGGCGRVEWEGKLIHSDPCPLCFGSCCKKCSACGGIRIKNASSLKLQQLPQDLVRERKVK